MVAEVASAAPRELAFPNPIHEKHIERLPPHIDIHSFFLRPLLRFDVLVLLPALCSEFPNRPFHSLTDRSLRLVPADRTNRSFSSWLSSTMRQRMRISSLFFALASDVAGIDIRRSVGTIPENLLNIVGGVLKDWEVFGASLTIRRVTDAVAP